MGARLLLFAASTWLTACGVPEGQMRISGEYKGLPQADFLFISTDGGLDMVDTLHIQQERFEHTIPLNGDATFNIIYPGNTLQLMLWAHSGDDIRIEGSQDDLWHVTVKGNEENELYTEFRQQCEANDTTQQRQTAAAFIREHADSPVATYLLTQYFILPDGLPTDSVQRLYKVVLDAQPQNTTVIALGGQISQRRVLRVGKHLPDFKLTTLDGKDRRLKDYKGKTLILYFWAGWQGSSYVLHRDLSQASLDAAALRGHEVEMLSYSLDVDSITLATNRNDDLFPIPTFCDYAGFEGSYVKQLGINNLPLILIIDTKGKIEYRTQNIEDAKKYLKKETD